MGVGVSSRQFVRSKYVFNYGVVEDIPVGSVVGLTGGYQYKNNSERLYLGLRLAHGRFFRAGYVSANFEYGSFIRNSHAEQSVLVAEVNYFTNLLVLGNWKFRQFAKPQATLGFNRFSTESININDANGIRGFNTVSNAQTQRMMCTLQSQFYSPWKVLGFRFGPYLISSFGVLGNNTSGFRESHVYSQFSLGVLIKNEYLSFATFQISLAYYPIIPSEGMNVLKFNPSSTTDFGLPTFDFGKPAMVPYK